MPLKIPSKLRMALSKLDKGFRILMKPMQIVGNFVFLSITYFLGIGLSSLWYRLTEGRKKEATTVDSFWISLPVTEKKRENWLRPF